MTESQSTLTSAAKLMQAISKPAIAVITVIAPPLIQFTGKTYQLYKKLPENAIQFIIGFIFCFFGGLYPTLFAAVQAAEHSGRKTVTLALSDLSEEAMVIIEESKKDDEKDDDKDGKADVQQIEGKEYMMRKTNLVLTKMNPEKVDKAIASIYRVWLSVLAVLTIQFARTISLALSISDFLRMPIDRFIAPTLQLAIPKEYKKWVPVILSWTTKTIAMSIAWYIQTIISAFTSALAGGLMMARAIYKFCVVRGIKMFGLIADNDEESDLDELLSYVFAASGFYFQYRLGFSLPFPVNLLLWPFELAEYYIRWTITAVN